MDVDLLSTLAADNVCMCRVQVARVAQHHAVSAPTTQPLFVYLPFQNVHEPHQAPQSYIDKYNEVNNTLRRATCAMVTAMDDAVETVVSGYVRAGLWDDTVLVFTTDNVRKQPFHHVGRQNSCQSYVSAQACTVLNPLCLCVCLCRVGRVVRRGRQETIATIQCEEAKTRIGRVA